jgi:hypothetical protein
MIRTLRAFFLSRLLREKLLLVAFAAIGVLLWVSSFSSRFGRFWRDERATAAALRDQSLWLANRPAVEAAVKKAASRLDPAKTLDGTRLLTEVSNLAAAAGLRNTAADTPTRTSNGQFSVNTLTYTVRGATWEALEPFYVALQQRSPYIGIDQFTLQPMGGNRTQLTLQLRVSSIEVPR